MILFKEEFEGVPATIRPKLYKMLEKTIRKTVKLQGIALRDPNVKTYTLEQVVGQLNAIFELAKECKVKDK